MKQILLAVLMLVGSFGLTACQLSPNVACNVIGVSSLSCSDNGVTVMIPVPTEVAVVLGLLTNSDAAQERMSAPSADAIKLVSCYVDMRHKMVHCTKNSTDPINVSYPVPKTATIIR